MMKEFDIRIREVSVKLVCIEAETEEEAIAEAERRWYDGEYIVDSEDFSGVEFNVENVWE